MKHRRYSTGWQFNMTPLIDVTFLLLTYFMLASHYASAEKPEDIEIPKPYESQAQDQPLPDRIYLNMLVEGPDRTPTLMLGPSRMGSLDELKEGLNKVGRAAPQTQIVLRADRHVRYGDVRQVMEAVAAAGLSRLQVVAELEQLP